MLPVATLPCSLTDLVAVFRPCFTAPSFRTFVGLVVGLIVVGLIGQTRRRTVCGMLIGAGLEQFWHHSRAHRFFAVGRWSSDAVGLALTDLIVTHLVPAGSPLTVAVDDTLFKRSGKKVFGVAWHHDGAAKGLQTDWVRPTAGSSPASSCRCRFCLARCVCRCWRGCGGRGAPGRSRMPASRPS
jgi:hypothetical protein